MPTKYVNCIGGIWSDYLCFKLHFGSWVDFARIARLSRGELQYNNIVGDIF